MDIPVTRVTNYMRRYKPADESTLGFGQYFSNHMFLMDYNETNDWHNPRIEPFAPLLLLPSAAVFHYAQEIFEGLKAYRNNRGEISLFRAKDNFRRMQNSAERTSMPAFPEDLAHEGLKKLIREDIDWVPETEGSSLYLRPFIIATESILGVHPSRDYLFVIITSPSGAYYASGFAPIKILVEDEYSRACQGGMGETKAGGNYAGSLKGQRKAVENGCSQVLWLDANEHRFAEEVGAMNIFFKFKDELVTPPLSGTILPGITRNSVLKITKDMGFNVSERKLAIEDIIAAAKSGDLVEIFGVGTAAVISPVGSLLYKGEDVTIGDGQTGSLSKDLYSKITGIQWGYEDDPYGWREVIANID